MEMKENQVVINLLRINAYLMREGDRIASKYGLNQQQFVVLNYIGLNHPINQHAICSSLLFGKSNLSKIVKKLVSLGYVNSKNSTDDKRSCVLKPTASGKEIVASALKDFNEFNKELFKDFTNAEITNALSVTDELNTVIRKQNE